MSGNRYRRLLSAAALIVFVLLAAGDVFAQEQAAGFALRGQVELGGSASFQSTTPVTNGKTGNSYSFLTLSPSVGVFVVDGLQVGVNPLGLSVVTSGGSSSTGILALGSIAYYPPSTRFAHPFVEGLAGYAVQTNGSTYSGFTWGGRGGVKMSITGNGLLTLGVQYLQITLNRDGATTRNGSNQLSISLGYTVWL